MSDIVQDILRDVHNMTRAEIRMARVELGETAQKAGQAAGLLGISAIVGLLGAICLVAALVAVLAIIMPLALSALLVGLALCGMAAGGYFAGRSRLREVEIVPKRTLETLKEDVAWIGQRNEK